MKLTEVPCNCQSSCASGGESPSAEGGDRPREFVRRSLSTIIGDLIRDTARGKELAVGIEGAYEEVRVGVLSFNDRTRLRMGMTARNDGIRRSQR